MSSTAVDDQFNEDRADAIGQNGPSGMHYGIMEQAGCKHGEAPEGVNVSASVTGSPAGSPTSGQTIEAARITGLCADGEPCGVGGNCYDCPNSPEIPDSSAAGIMEAALGHLRDRAATYDKAEAGGDRAGGERSIGAAVEAFQAVTGDGLVSTAERGWMFMILLKLVRTQQGGYRADNYEDATAYAALMGEAAAGERDQ